MDFLENLASECGSVSGFPAESAGGAMDEDDVKAPGWAEDILRVASRVPRRPPQRGGDPYAWLDEPWEDVARRRPGEGLVQESRSRWERDEASWSWRVGAEGEYVLAEALKELIEPRGLGRLRRGRGATPWCVLHGPKIGSAAVADVDHVLVGPPGLVVINAKMLSPKYPVTLHDGEVAVGTFRRDFVRKVREDAGRTRWLLATAADAVLERRRRGDLPSAWDFSGSWGVLERFAAGVRGAGAGQWPPVTPALGFVGSGGLEEQMGPVVVARASTISRMLRERPSVVDARHVSALYELARRSTTWTRDAPRGRW